jgi:hypothetical protein
LNLPPNDETVQVMSERRGSGRVAVVGEAV